MECEATAKYIRVSTRKVRFVADSVRTLAPAEALARLSQMTTRAARPLVDVLESALANAKQKQANEAMLQFKSIEVMGGPATKRWRAVSRGQAHAYKKRMTHIRVTLTDEVEKHQASNAKHQTNRNVQN